ncbi:enoyl-CoA hydratase/isomerase family protein [Corynebacterium sp.]|uniref:enoyl-CoA hydratase/isomerase family protein n=1 Tax=Corynebacterium sp. TaxID=1720 RepID=UPI0028ADD4C7|nr:enoyl-CoA hydratase/isomerase family protein [Corynebacterium sp.]
MSTMTEIVAEDGIVRILLNRPTALNALNFQMIAEIEDAIATANSDRSARVILIEGAGKAFCAGDDLIDMSTEKNPAPPNKFEEFHDGYPLLARKIADSRIPVICVVHKYCLGAGLELALSSDFILAEEDTVVGLPFVKRGIASGTTLLPQLTNRLFASRLLFTGEMVKVNEFEKFGLIAETFSKDDRTEVINRWLQQLSSAPTNAISLMKKQLRFPPADQESAWISQAHSTVSSALTKDFAEGKSAFQEKRDPVFTGE